MKIAIVTFDGFNEIDSFVAAYMRVRDPGSTDHYYIREVTELVPGAVTAADLLPPG